MDDGEQGEGEQKHITVSSKPRINVGPYPVDQPKENSIRFTPRQGISHVHLPHLCIADCIEGHVELFGGAAFTYFNQWKPSQVDCTRA